MKTILNHIDEYEPFEWSLNDQLGYGFENDIFQIVNKQLEKNFDDGVRVHQTPVGPDGGKDIIIDSPISLCILNQKFDIVNKSEFTIYIECKSSEKKRIGLNKVAESLARIRQSKGENKIDYYMLVSNSTLTPQSLFILENDFEIADIKFKVVDQPLLLKAIKNENISINVQKDLEPKLYYEYQVSPTKVDNKKAYDIFFTYRNLGNQEQLVTQRLLTDNNWSIDEIERKFLVNVNDIYVNKFTVVRDFADGIEELLFSVENNGITEKQIQIEGTGISPAFEPPFFGTDHKNCEDFLIARIKKSIGFDLCCIWGEAGIGKTRVFNETFKKLDGQGFNFFSVAVRTDNKFIKDIKKFLINKKYLEKDNKSETLRDMLLFSKNEFMRAIILIDDSHNISDNTLNELKSLNNENIPITIVLCGRTDYSVGTTDYYSFVQYTEKNEKIGTWQLTSFSDDDTRKFISLIIKRLPKVALDKICKMSNNNPLFIIHFIEYLLELNLVEIQNRSSVGITNLKAFNSHLYIPKKVEEIYKMRIEHLRKNEHNAENLIRYLHVLSILQDRQSKEMALTCLSEENLNFLIQRRFLNFSENGEIIFSHESLAIFIRQTLENDIKLKKKFANDFFSDLNYLLKYVSTYEKGVLALWAGKKKLAKEYFADIIEQIEQTTNHSAFNVDFKSNKYLTNILELFAKDKGCENFLTKTIKTKIYTSTHHFSPTIAIIDCDNILKYLDKNIMLKKDRCLTNSVKQQKAHAMINAGYLIDAELLMKELLSDFLVCRNTLDEDTVFDLFDRFCGIYTHFNCRGLALNFNEMSRTEKALSDNRLMALVYLSHAKIFFYSDFETSSRSFLKVQELLKNGDSHRILCSSKISHLIIELLHMKRCDYDVMIKETYMLLEEAFNGNFSHSIARIYLVLSVLHLISGDSAHRIIDSINRGINYSTKFGFVRELWEFYNVLGIIQLREGADAEEIRKTFETAYTLLLKHDYLNLGMRDLCCSNTLVLSNIGFFYQSKKTEKEFYEHMSKVTFFEDSIHNKKTNNLLPTKFLKDEYLKAKQKRLLFTRNPNNSLLRDNVNGYFIALS